MTSNGVPERYIITLQGTTTQGGLLKAHVTDNCEGDIRLDGSKPQDESCQFYLHDRFDLSHGQPQRVHRFESVKYNGYNLYWNDDDKTVNLMKCDGNDDALADKQRIWWSIPDCSSELTRCPELTPGLKLLKPFDFPQPGDTFPYVLVFDKHPSLTSHYPNIVATGQFQLDKMA